MVHLTIKSIREFIKNKVIGTQYEWESHFENVLRLFDNICLYKPHNLLDVGFGSGDRTIRIAKYFRIDMNNVYGIDNNDQQVVSCGNTFNAKKIDLEMENIPYQDNTFDIVICNQVLEHLKNYRKVINEMIRITKRSGYIIIGIPNLAHLINRIYLLFGIQPMCIDIDSSHVRAFTHKSFVKKISSIQNVTLIDYKGSLMYPLPFFIGNQISDYFVGLSGYVCYLLRKIR